MIISACVKRGEYFGVGASHSVAIHDLNDLGMNCESQYGFLTDDFQFLDREQAFVHAVECGQVPPSRTNRVLTSQHLELTAEQVARARVFAHAHNDRLTEKGIL